jgi:hypothetical protein
MPLIGWRTHAALKPFVRQEVPTQNSTMDQEVPQMGENGSLESIGPRANCIAASARKARDSQHNTAPLRDAERSARQAVSFPGSLPFRQ